MGIREIWDRFTQKKDRFKDMQEQEHLTKILEERKKSANERELDSYMEERRQANIKSQIDRIRKQKQREMWHKNIFKGKNLFNGPSTILNNNNKLFGNGKTILDAERLFFS